MASKNEVKISEDVHRHNKDELSTDEIQLRAQGHVGELPRQFSAFSIVAIAYSIVSCSRKLVFHYLLIWNIDEYLGWLCWSVLSTGPFHPY